MQDSAQQALAIAKQHIFEPVNLTERELERALSDLLSRRQVDAADIYLQHLHSESWLLENSMIKTGVHNTNRGVGVRALSGEKTGFAYADAIMAPAIAASAEAAGTIARSGSSGTLCASRTFANLDCYQPLNPISGFEAREKVDYLLSLDQAIRKIDYRIQDVNLTLAGVYEVVLMMAEDGLLAADVRPLVRLSATVIARENKRLEQGISGGGGRFGYQQLFDENRGLAFGQQAARKALLNLEARPAPAGVMPVVLGAGWPGVLLHEAVGHGLEGDFNRKKLSEYSGRVGEQVASKLCTVVDNGTLPHRRGSLNIDDEGTQTQCTVLIERGVLKGYMQDKFNARLMGQASTGNGRRESYSHVTMPRMTNTYMLPGDSDPQEIISSVGNGLYAVDFGGGSVDITSGEFVFSATEAYLIENGEITAPVKGATLIGKGPEVMSNISMVGNDLKLDTGIGVCGKEGQSVPVGVGQPTLKIDQLTVGGTEA